MGVPFIDIKRFENGFLDKWNSKTAEMSKNAQFIGGEEVAKIEKSLAEYTETKFSVSCANGTDAIQLALRAVGIGRGKKVLLPNSTFWATFEAVVNVGADPYTVDTDLVDLQMDFSVFEKAADEIKPDAAIIVHLYGWGSASLLKFREFCRSRNIPLIEDGAQCFGVRINGESIYKNAYISTTSFYPAKVLGAAGDGGAVFTNDAGLADTVRKLANHGRTSHYGHGFVGWNSRLDSLQAAFLNLSMEVFSSRLESRKKIAKKYQADLKTRGYNVITPPSIYEENGYCNAMLLPNSERTKLEALLKENGIGFANIYPGAMSDQEGSRGFLVKKFGGDNAREISSTVLNLPLFAYMTDSEYSEVLSVIDRFKK